ncbi:MAG: hypothetical protein R3B47_09325 [Bacteroidia bacterium]
MHLHFLTESNLRDRLFVQQYVHAFKPGSKVLIVVDQFGGTLRDSRFVTKRLSTLMSEQMVYNNAFTGEQRDMCRLDENGLLSLRKGFIAELISPLQALLIGSVASSATGPQLIAGSRLAEALRAAFDIEKLMVFPGNPLSPLSMKQREISTQADIADLLVSYEEEKEALELALRLAPAILSGPNFSV